MAQGIDQYGIAHRHDDGSVTLLRPGKTGNRGIEIEVPATLAEECRLASGDIVEGPCVPIDSVQVASVASSEWYEHYELLEHEEQPDEPSALRGYSIPDWLSNHVMPTERLTDIVRINGLERIEAEERPYPRKRNNAERSQPDRWLPLASRRTDTTGRMLDFVAPLGMGCVGMIYGPHASGLTRTLETVVAGVTANAPDILAMVLLLRARGEEVTEWRRRFPQADVVVCPNASSGATPDETLRVANLTLACAQRQTELGRHVLIAVDSLTGLWGTMLEAERADTQTEADQSRARHTLRDWVQKAGCFGGPGLLGSTLGGSLTLIGTVWHQTQMSGDLDAEDERDIHPHLRLLEHLLYDTNWRIPLSEQWMRDRLFPAIDTGRCLSQPEERLLPAELFDRLLNARGRLARMEPIKRHLALLDAIDRAETISVPIEPDSILSILNPTELNQTDLNHTETGIEVPKRYLESLIDLL